MSYIGPEVGGEIAHSENNTKLPKLMEISIANTLTEVEFLEIFAFIWYRSTAFLKINYLSQGCHMIANVSDSFSKFRRLL